MRYNNGVLVMPNSERKPKQSRATFDGMSWPIPNHEIGWKMRYGNPTREERLQAAGEMDAYAALLVRSQKRRNYICKKIVEAINAD